MLFCVVLFKLFGCHSQKRFDPDISFHSSRHTIEDGEYQYKLSIQCNEKLDSNTNECVILFYIDNDQRDQIPRLGRTYGPVPLYDDGRKPHEAHYVVLNNEKTYVKAGGIYFFDHKKNEIIHIDDIEKHQSLLNKNIVTCYDCDDVQQCLKDIVAKISQYHKLQL